MAENNGLRRLVFGMVAEGTLDAEAAMALLARAKDLAPEPSAPVSRDIAIVGMAGRFGNAPDLDSFWRMLESGDDCLIEMPERRWPAAMGPRRRGGFLPDEDRFDPLFFRISPTEAAMTDPQQRLFLETAYHALEDAGYAERTLSGMRCGVFAGAGAGDYAQRFRDAGLQSNALGLMGNVTSILAARISYFLNLKGPSVALDTACSSSLVAVHLACESLMSGTCDMALAGGVAVISTPQFIGAMTDGGMLSPNDRCAAFDATADGFVCGEGAGVVVLKRLADAERDGDNILGIVRGSGINQDGRTNGITAPSAPSQAALEEDIYRRRSIDPASITYVETHGTGTPLGDPIELEALTSSFRKFTDRVGFCAIGSAKANIGHALTAAGIAGLLKVLLMMRHRRIPPMAGFSSPNPRIDFASSPFTVPTVARDWEPAGPRRAAVSSFGFSGTNAHLVIEEPPARSARPAKAGPFLFLLSARGEAALRARASALAAWLERSDAEPADIATTLAAGREHHVHRLAVVADDITSLRDRLSGWLDGQRHASVLAGEARAEGPGPALMAFAKTIARDRPDQESLCVLGDLYTQGAAFDWTALPGASAGRRVSLPGYPFERMACGIPAGAEAEPPPAAIAEVIKDRPPAVTPLDGLSAVTTALARHDAPDLSAQAGAFRAVEAWGRKALSAAYDRMGLYGRRVHTVGGLRKRLGIIPSKQRLHDALVDMLVRDGTLLREGDLLRIRQPAATALDAERARLSAAEPELAPFLTLLARCIDALPDLLTGRVTATEVMFPDGRTDLVEPIYQGSRLAEHLNTVLAEAVATLSAGLGRPARVIELGAGTGGATASILRLLTERGIAVEYHYTDISRGFAHLGRTRFGASHDFMRFDVLDIEKDPAAQGFEPGAFDIVVASNVLHACRLIGAALDHASRLLRPGGWLVLNEVTALQDYATLTFGLTDGWWAFEDAASRIVNAPLLDVGGWQAAMAAAGFPRMDAFGLPGEARDRLSQAVMVAERSGVAATPVTALVTSQDLAAAASPGADGASLPELIAREVAILLNMPVERLDHRGRFMDYGIDSILGGQVVAQLNKALGLDLRPIVLFDHPSIADLARHIAREYGDRVRKVPPPPAAQAPDPSARSWSGLTRPPLGSPPAGQKGQTEQSVAMVGSSPTMTGEEPASPSSGSHPDTRIAVIGMAGRFADCPDIAAFHDMLRQGRSGITTVPADRWSADAASLPEGVSSEAQYLKWGGFLRDAADFDPLFFRMSGKEAELTDPQHRVFLTEAWRALEDAGYAEQELDGRRCGVFVGAYGGDYTHRMTDLGIVPEAFAFMGNAAAILSGRIAYVLNLKGPCMAVDTACSSSLSAIHLACRSLLDGECEMALAGGVFLTTTMGFNTAAAKAGMLSPNGACRAFDADADGFVPGEGAGVVVLKPYARALADGDHIEAVIIASAMNQDGKTNGITAPSADSQAALETEVYEKAGINPDAIGYIEAHGTGTRLGDPIEVEGLTRAFRRWTDRTGFCVLGSVKTNIGHAAHAAGIAGFLKAVLTVRHRTFFPSLHFRSENPALHLSESPFVVNTVLRPWETDGAPRMAGVSSFGFSGTNVHILLAEPDEEPVLAVADEPCLITLSARSPASLARRIADLRAWLETHTPALADMARTLNGGRSHFDHRWAAVVGSVADLRAALASGAPASTGSGFLREAAATYLRTGDVPAEAIPAGGRRISLPTYPFEMRRYWLDREGDMPPAVSQASPARANYLVTDWQAEPLPTAALPGPIWLLADGDGPGPALAALWRGQGHRVTEVAPADLVDRRRLDGAPAGVVNLLGLNDLGTDLGRGEQAVFATLRALFNDPVQVLHVHRGGPARECVQALRRSARFDGAQVDLRLLRLDGALPTTGALASMISAELAAPHGAETEVAIRDGNRLVRRMVAAFPGPSVPLRQGAHILITGGGGVLAGLFARRLVREAKARITLIGRSPANDAVRATLAACPGALYRQADVTDLGSLAAVVAEARGVHGPVHGVIHAAGVPAVTSLRDSGWPDVAACLAPKVVGTLTLDRVLGDEPLDFFVLFSSLAGELGDFGQGAYACGNAFCDRFAAWRDTNRPGRTIALGWPLWREGRGVLSAEGERIYLATSGMPYLETEQGWQAFLDALAMGHAQVAVVPGDPAKALALFATRPVAAAGVPMQGAPVRSPASQVPAAPLSVGAAPIATDPDLPATVRRGLTALISRLMKVDEDLLSPTAGLAEFGFDSIALKGFSVRLGEVYGITISPAVFFARGTIEALADYLVESHPAEVTAHHAVRTEPPPAPVAAPPPPVRKAGRDEPIAIIGISGRFPRSPDLDTFWQHLEAGTDLVGPLPDGRDLASRGGYDRGALQGGFLDRIDTFDAPFFRISPREACFLDPQHRLAIEAVWHCVEDAGLRMGALAGRPVGVFFGPQINEYGAIIPDRDAARAQIALGNIATMLPNRISYLFDLRGPSEAIDTACSSSLVAVNRAIRALQAGECEMALAGGVSLVLTAESIVSTMELGVVSPDGRCHSFDSRANGYVKGEGVGVVLLKPLSRAEADGDVIHAVILGSAENHGGHAHSLTAPNGTAQAALIATALRRAGVPSDTIGYVEAHGTGTELGDPVEVMALKEAFGVTAEPGSVRDRACLLGTVKTNIGHLEPASGVAGLLKAVLALEHRVLPASLHFRQLNPLIDFANTPFAVADATRPWDALIDGNGAALPRRAGVSSFGLGGSNAHVVLEEYAPHIAGDPDPAAVLLVVSARDRDRLQASLRRLADFARRHPLLPVRDVAHTLAVGREVMAHRAAILWRSGETLADRFDGSAGAVGSGSGAAGVWIGSVTRPGIGRAEADRGPGMMTDLAAAGQWDRVAALWVEGADLPVTATRGRRIALPGYPFAPSRFWFDRAPGGSPGAAGQAPAGPAAPVQEHARSARPAAVAPAVPRAPVQPERQEAMAGAGDQAVTQASRPVVPLGPVTGRSETAVRAVVRRHLAAALYLDEAQLDEHAGFADLGLDSILAVELTKSLNDELGTALQATRLYDHANIVELAGYLAGEPGLAPVVAEPSNAMPLEAVRDIVRRHLAQALYLDESQIDDQAGFADLGLDSILAVELTRALNEELGTDLQATRLYDHPNAAELAVFLHGSLTDRATTTVDPAAAPALAFLRERLAPFGAPNLSATTRLDTIALQPADAKAILDAITDQFGCALTEADVARCRDLGSLAGLIVARSTPAPVVTASPPPPVPAARAVPPPVPATPTQAPAALDTATPDVAIIGYACRLPGAPDADAFWDHLRAGDIAVTPFPPEDWRREAYAGALRALGSDMTPWGGYVAGVDRFDARFFSIRAEQARLMDPQQRLFLETAWHALEMGGQTRALLDGAACGVFVGGGSSDYGRVLEADHGPPSGETLFGNIASILAARIAYFLNLHGPCVALDTACSSGLVALHAGWRAIRDGECDMALVGGVNLLLTPQMHVLTGSAGMLSRAGQCRSFDDAADGFVPAEGIVTLVLKRLDRALADGDPIQGVINGVAINQNGTTAGITAPSAKAQTRLLRAAYARGAIPLDQVGLVEAHGTGTRIGDALEFDALRTVFAEAGVPEGAVVLGSAKPAIGHSFAASGLASVVKLLLAMRHQVIPLTLGVDQANGHMALAGSPFRINKALEPWSSPSGGRRMAAATAYGLSGTNAHVVLSEPPARAPTARSSRMEHLLVVSATDPTALGRQIEALATALEHDRPDIADLAYTLGARRTHFAARAAFVARDMADFRAQLAAWPAVAPPKGALAELAARYRDGGTLDWADLYPAGTVCRLPPYRFSPDRHWPGAPEAGDTPAAIAPTTPDTLLQTLLPIVARGLSVDPALVTSDTSFDTLGLTSVAAVTLMRDAEVAFGVSLPVIALWDHPTPAQLAAYIASRPPATAEPALLAQAGRTASGAHDPVVPVRAEGDGPISFWVHGGPGDTNWVTELARLSPPDHRIFGLEALGLDGEAEPLPTVEAMAAHYTAAILRTQPVGPYRIGGYSAGGAIAFDVVRRLIRAGHGVERLTLLDANAPGNAGLADMQAAFGPGYVHLVVGGWLATRWGADRALTLGDLAGLDKEGMLERVLDHLFAHASPPLPRADVRRMLVALDRVGWSVGQALRDYRPTRLDGLVDVVMIACEAGMAGGENPLGLPDTAAARDYRDGWDALFVAPMRVIPLACDHFSLFRGEAADALRAHLADAPADRVTEIVLALVRETLPDVPADLVVPARSMTELGATSIDRVDVATLAMESLGVRVPNEALAGVASIGDLIDLLRQHAGHG